MKVHSLQTLSAYFFRLLICALLFLGPVSSTQRSQLSAPLLFALVLLWPLIPHVTSSTAQSALS